MTVAQETRVVGTVTGGRTGGWMMALSPLGYVVLIATMAGVFAGTIGANTFADMTRAQMDRIGFAWVLVHLITALAGVIPLIGAGLLALTLLRAGIRAGRWAAWATLFLTVVNILTPIPDIAGSVAQLGFTAPTLGEDPSWNAGASLLPLTFGLCFLQLLMLCVALWRSGTRSTIGLVMGVICLVVLLVVALAAPFVPPFAVALIACPIGISWLRGLRRAAQARRGLS